MIKQSKKLLANFIAIASLLLSATAAQADNNTGAYGPQAQMSPATTSSSLSIGNNGGANNPGNGGYIPGNGVYLTGQAAIMPQPGSQQMMSPNIAAAPQGMPTNGGQYYGQQTAPAYGSPYANYGGSSYPGGYPQQAQPNVMPGQMGYSQNTQPYGGYPSAADPAGTYSTSKPAYGTPAHMVQRNSSNYYNQNLPYRNNPSVTLNPNSYTNPQQPNGPKYNDQVMGILNNSQPTQSTSTLKPASNKLNPGNWVNKVFQKGNRR